MMTYVSTPGPDPRDVAALTELLNLLSDFRTNEDRARYILTCNWFVREGVAVATRSAANDALFWAAAHRCDPPAGGPERTSEFVSLAVDESGVSPRAEARR